MTGGPGVEEALERALEDPSSLLDGAAPEAFLEASARMGDATPHEAALQRVRAWGAGLGGDPEFERLEEIADALGEALLEEGEALAFGVMTAAHPFGAETVTAAWQASYGRVPGTMAVARALAVRLAARDAGAGEGLSESERVEAGRWPWVVGATADACELRGADGEGWLVERRGGRMAVRPLD